MRLTLLSFLILFTSSLFADNPEQDATVECFEVKTIPVIDGSASDACWNVAKWQAIDQTWIPWGEYIEPDDFTARYKTVWSSSTNLMYFVVEITDDIISDAYKPGETADIYNFDMIEVFIDQDKSGGEHVSDSNTSNAENAFAYHIFAKVPEIGIVSYDYYVTDIASTGWNTDFSNHLPDFAISYDGDVRTYEFSLIVYDDTYGERDDESARVTLQKDMIMGLSLAANDDDEPEINPIMTTRDNMIGSVAVLEQNNNNHWMLADDFGTVMLLASTETKVFEPTANSLITYPNPTTGMLNIKNSDYSHFQLLTATGRLAKDFYSLEKEFSISVSELKSGIYILKAENSVNNIQQKIIIQ